MRNAIVERQTKETKISVSLEIDGKGESEIDTGCGFLDHMLTLFSAHGSFNLRLSCIGDIEVDAHHTVEDCGIALGTAFKKALADLKGITRYGEITLPMDEALIGAYVDISGRDTYCHNFKIPSPKVGDFDTELTNEFFLAFVRNMGLTLHINQIRGENSHHIIEGAFKAFARAMKVAVSIDENAKDKIPSTKGLI